MFNGGFEWTGMYSAMRSGFYCSRVLSRSTTTTRISRLDVEGVLVRLPAAC